MQGPGPSKYQDNPEDNSLDEVVDDIDVDADVSGDPQQGPSCPEEFPVSFSDTLKIPDSDLWNGILAGNYVYFVDNIGFGWHASLKTDEFFLLSDVYDVSSLMQYPRS